MSGTGGVQRAPVYEQRRHYESGTSGIAAIGILPSEASTPCRVQPLVWRVTDSENGTWRHESV